MKATLKVIHPAEDFILISNAELLKLKEENERLKSVLKIQNCYCEKCRVCMEHWEDVREILNVSRSK